MEEPVNPFKFILLIVVLYLMTLAATAIAAISARTINRAEKRQQDGKLKCIRREIKIKTKH